MSETFTKLDICLVHDFVKVFIITTLNISRLNKNIHMNNLNILCYER